MIQRVYESSKGCPELGEVYVATDDVRIYNCVEQFGGCGIMTGQAHKSGTDRIAEAVGKLNLDQRDIVVNIQGDQPMFDPSILTDLIGALTADETIPMSTLSFRITEDQELNDVNTVKVVVDNKGYALYFSRLPIPFSRDQRSKTTHYKHLGFYAYRKEFLLTFTRLPFGSLEGAEKLEQLRALEHGFKIRVIETPFDSIEVDVPEDVEIVEKKLTHAESPEL